MSRVISNGGLAVSIAIPTITWVVTLVMQILLAIHWLPIQLCREFSVFNFYCHIQVILVVLRVGLGKILFRVCQIVRINEVKKLVLGVGPNKNILSV